MHCLRLPTVVLLLGAGMAPAATLPDRLLVTLQARALVAVDGNFGASPGNPSHASGAVPSVDPRAVGDTNPPRAPTQLATSAPINGATVMLYSAQAAYFMNRPHNGSARTADFAGVSSPRYISVNNAFGRPWIANATAWTARGRQRERAGRRRSTAGEAPNALLGFNEMFPRRFEAGADSPGIARRPLSHAESAAQRSLVTAANRCKGIA